MKIAHSREFAGRIPTAVLKKRLMIFGGTRIFIRHPSRPAYLIARFPGSSGSGFFCCPPIIYHGYTAGEPRRISGQVSR